MTKLSKVEAYIIRKSCQEKDGKTTFVCNQCREKRTVISSTKRREVACKCCGILYYLTINRRELGEVVRMPAREDAYAVILLPGKNKKAAQVRCRMADYNNNGLGIASIPSWVQKELRVGQKVTLKFPLAYNNCHTDTFIVCWMKKGRAGFQYIKSNLNPWQRVHQNCQEKSP